VVLMNIAAVLIDGGYLRAINRKYFASSDIDFQLFSDRLCGDCERFRTYYYICMPYQSNPPTEAERKLYSGMDSFLYNLKQLPRFEIRLGRLVKKPRNLRALSKRVWTYYLQLI